MDHKPTLDLAGSSATSSAIRDENRWEKGTRLVFETLWYLQKKSIYKKLYFFSIFVSALHTMYYPLNDHFPWSKSTLNGWPTFLYAISLPVYELERTSFYFIFGIVCATLLSAIAAGYFVAVSLDNADGRSDFALLYIQIVPAVGRLGRNVMLYRLCLSTTIGN
eukprot:TRINITY_DN1303_c0_g1::TRINITY_DN1303_c0_g1_i3::g.19960::m.19960 TRINITY_DN1303_c0_g1::TRINITY_DN1303_c0_g1_i3::g.19960  ORF type:complete len:164 (+),score=0.57 TRINITY_DN1303_c0_g1_i3:133-624(+)